MDAVSFGPFVLRLDERRLWRDGVRVPLKAREAALLGLLAERRPDVVGKDELIERFWGGVATDAALAITVCRLRKKLKQFGGDCDAIRTVAGVGFQFAARTFVT